MMTVLAAAASGWSWLAAQPSPTDFGGEPDGVDPNAHDWGFVWLDGGALTCICLVGTLLVGSIVAIVVAASRRRGGSAPGRPRRRSGSGTFRHGSSDSSDSSYDSSWSGSSDSSWGSSSDSSSGGSSDSSSGGSSSDSSSSSC